MSRKASRGCRNSLQQPRPPTSNGSLPHPRPCRQEREISGPRGACLPTHRHRFSRLRSVRLPDAAVRSIRESDAIGEISGTDVGAACGQRNESSTVFVRSVRLLSLFFVLVLFLAAVGTTATTSCCVRLSPLSVASNLGTASHHSLGREGNGSNQQVGASLSQKQKVPS